MTKKEMHDQVKQWLGLQEITVYDEGPIIDQQLYQGTIDVLARTRCTARCVELTTIAGQDSYLLDHAILCLVDVEDGRSRRARRDEVWSCTCSLNPCTCYWPRFTLIRSDVLVLKPAPTQDDLTVQTWAVLLPDKMDEDGDSPADEAYGAVPPEYHDAIVLYALWKCADYGDDSSSQAGERYRTLYEGQNGFGGRLAQIRISVNKRGTARAPSRRVRLRGVHSHGSYVG
jgi:hypothetical protein